jgi:3-oxoacyl-[acyl-carrier protein] reductase
MLIDLSGNVAIVTGAGRGIGREIARTFATEGATVVVLDLGDDQLKDARAEWAERRWSGAQLVCDIRDKAACAGVAAEVERRFGRIDVLINNAGIARGGPVETLPEEVWDANFDANLKGIFLMAQAVIPVMKRQQSGRIINAASFAAIIPSLGSAAYASSKAGVHALTRVLAGELGPFGITVNCYAPGMVPTEMNHFAEASPERQEALLDTLSIRRWQTAEDVANLVCFLASDRASYITGAMIEVSGGKFATQMPWLAYRDAR